MSIGSILSDPDIRLVVGAPEDTLIDAVKHMVDNNVNAVVILNDSMKLVGILTDHDITKALYAKNGDLEGARVSDWMTENVITCLPETKLSETLKLMTFHGIRHLVVADEQKPLALLGVRKVLEKIHEHDELESNVLRDIATAARASNVA